MAIPIYINAVTVRNSPFRGTDRTLGSAGALPRGLGDFQDDLIRGLVKSVRLESKFTPTIELSAADLISKDKSLLGSLLRPKLTIELTSGSPITFMPYGDPGGSVWPVAALGSLAVGGLAIYGLLKLLKRRK